MGDNLMSVVYFAAVCIIPVLLAVTLHDVAHGWTVGKLGDYMAQAIGRVSFHSLRHIEPVGTVARPEMLLIFSAPFMLGGTKPVPVNFTRLRDPKRAIVIVAGAGPAINFGLTYHFALCLQFMSSLPPALASLLARFEKFGFAIMFAIMFVFPFLSRQLEQKFDPFSWPAIGPVNYITRIIAIAAGIQ